MGGQLRVSRSEADWTMLRERRDVKSAGRLEFRIEAGGQGADWDEHCCHGPARDPQCRLSREKGGAGGADVRPIPWRERPRRSETPKDAPRKVTLCDPVELCNCPTCVRKAVQKGVGQLPRARRFGLTPTKPRLAHFGRVVANLGHLWLMRGIFGRCWMATIWQRFTMFARRCAQFGRFWPSFG